MLYAVSCNGKLYLISLEKATDPSEGIRKVLEKRLGKKDLIYSFIEVHGKEYENNKLPLDDPKKEVIFYDNMTPNRTSYKFFNKDIVNLD